MSDERLTTVEADELMDEMGIRGADRKKYVDMLAAAVILRDYMNSHPEKLEELRGM
jgi:putative Holliday junction resolvase